jgi:deoxycytidine triphosphate deaminase
VIVGQQILDSQLVTGGTAANLKNSTFDLTVGSIIPIGKDTDSKKKQIIENRACFLEPREMVWVLSREEFNIPSTVTGIATLRTTFTKAGLLALNVGIIDPLFRGPISTALINFSDRPREIRIGEKFFRLIFFEHNDVSAFHGKDESMERENYLRDLKSISYSDFAPSFLNIPSFDDKYYTNKFWSIIGNGILSDWGKLLPFYVTIGLVMWFLFAQGFGQFLWEKFEWVANIKKHFDL